MSAEAEKWCVVTGGRGFVARHLVEMLIRSGSYLVRIADLAPSIKLESNEENGALGDALRSGRAQYFSFDLRDRPQVGKGHSHFSYCHLFYNFPLFCLCESQIPDFSEKNPTNFFIYWFECNLFTYSFASIGGLYDPVKLIYVCSYLFSAVANMFCSISAALQGTEAVFHMAAPNSSINDHQLHHSVNVEG